MARPGATPRRRSARAIPSRKSIAPKAGRGGAIRALTTVRGLSGRRRSAIVVRISSSGPTIPVRDRGAGRFCARDGAAPCPASASCLTGSPVATPFRPEPSVRPRGPPQGRSAVSSPAGMARRRPQRRRTRQWNGGRKDGAVDRTGSVCRVATRRDRCRGMPRECRSAFSGECAKEVAHARRRVARAHRTSVRPARQARMLKRARKPGPDARRQAGKRALRPDPGTWDQRSEAPGAVRSIRVSSAMRCAPSAAMASMWRCLSARRAGCGGCSRAVLVGGGHGADAPCDNDDLPDGGKGGDDGLGDGGDFGRGHSKSSSEPTSLVSSGTITSVERSRHGGRSGPRGLGRGGTGR